jgi:hypothetical protein
MVPTDAPNWTPDLLTKYEKQMRRIAAFWKNELKYGIDVETYFFPQRFQGRSITQRPSHSCGAGRDSTIDKIHDFLYRAFLWQRWIIQKTYQNEKQQR